jgi:hypothetical protein
MNRNEKAARKKRARLEKRSSGQSTVIARVRPTVERAPTEGEKAVVVEEVRRAVSEELAGHGIDHLGGTCVYLAGVACGVLLALDPFERMAWRVRAGGAAIQTGAEDEHGPLGVGYDYASSLDEGGSGEFHAWVVGGDGPSTLVVDLTIGDFERLANQSSIAWNRTLPEYLWGDAASVEAQGLWYGSHPVATEEVEQALLLNTLWFVRATRRAIDACAARGITRLF